MSVSKLKAIFGPRRLATEILVKVDTQKAFADELLDDMLRCAQLSKRDRALLTELTYGTLRWRRRLDACLKPWIRRPLRNTDPFIRNLLRLTLYQLLFLDRVPDYAALDDAVELAKNHGGAKAGGFVNAVVRSYLRGKNRLAKPDPLRSPLSAVAEYWSHPDWLVGRWLKYFGVEEIEALLKANNDEAPLVLRTNALEGTRGSLLQILESKGIKALPTPWSPEGISVRSRMPVDQLPGFPEGRFQVQGEASQLVVHLLDPKPGEKVLDACAAPGGKATHIAEAMNDRGEVIATDISESGLRKIAENTERLKLKSVRIFHADVSDLLDERLGPPFDRILIDAPCSGFGTLRSHPEIKWHRSQRDIERLSRLQAAILDRLSAYLKPGGVLVYSTCTLIEDENEKIVKNFLQRRNEFVLDDAAGYLPEQAKLMVRGRYFFALPHRHNTDGFFAARMRKVT